MLQLFQQLDSAGGRAIVNIDDNASKKIIQKTNVPFVTYGVHAKADLTVKPNVDSSYGPNATSFKIYLESSKKLYVPKHYGINNLGEPTVIKLPVNTDRSFKFVGEL